MAREQRKTVTVLFCDLAGSTALGESVDPERLRVLLARYFERMKGIVEHHGATVEKFIGDAVMAVFGVPTVHEDDALRAVRAAIEMRDALPDLGLEGRIGVMTGEVVTGTEERLATGDAVNVAARLEQAAQPGEVLIGASTLALVHDAVDVEAIDPLVLKGKAEPVAAHRLLRVRDLPERRHAGRFVGRETELALLRQAWERTRDDECCELVTVIGEAGGGKSRLTSEFTSSIDATVARGRCLPYGDGITYWPVVEVLKQLGLVPADDIAAAALRSLLRESDAPTSSEEIAWAFRKTLEHAATERPLVVLFDDVQWGEDTFRDLIEHVALLSAGAPILLLCIARPELVERHPTWPVTLRLEPLDAEDVDRLIPDQIVGGLRDRIARAAGGNPLFVEEMVAMAVDADGDVVVPPTLHALLAARLDQLEPSERGVLERGAVEGEIFHRGAVQALALDEPQVTPRLAALVRKQLIKPDKPQLPGEDGFRFRHILIRDAAYEALPKAVRANLHALFAAWLETHGADLVELDEILAHHLEQAYVYSVELGVADHELAASARRHLTAAGRRASLRQDFAAAVNLLERSAALAPPGQIDVALEAELAEGLFWQGNGQEALRRADLLTETAHAAGNRLAELSGRVMAARFRCFLDPGETNRLAAVVDEALPLFEAADDQLGMYLSSFALGHVRNMRGQIDASLEAYDRAAVHARAAGLQDEFVGWRASKRHYGTTHASELLPWLDEHEPRQGRNHWLQAYRAGALAMLGRIDEARETVATMRSELADRGGGASLATMLVIAASEVELVAADYARAAELAAEACKLHEADAAEGFLFAGAAEMLAQALYGLDRLEEADTWAKRAGALAAGDPSSTHGRPVEAKVLARRGEHAAAVRLAREVIEILASTDVLNEQGNAFTDLADVLLLAGREGDAVAALEQALERYERKGNVVSAERTRSRLTELEPTTLV
jgi:class 3 adenylate cyclase/tetratricopeptide (TPR) repeat protein